MENSASTGGPVPRPAKKSLFNRPAGRKAPPRQTASTPENLFERSKQSFDAILAERQRKHQANKAREKEQEVTKQRELDGVGSRKKRRISTETDEESGGDFGQQKVVRKPSPRRSRSRSTEPLRRTRKLSETSLEINKSPDTSAKSAIRPTSDVIDVSSGSDSEADPPTIQAQIPRSDYNPDNRSQLDQAPDDDAAEEFPELAAAARARARQRELETRNQAHKTQTNFVLGGAETTSAMPVISSPPAAPDPVVKLLITSPIIGCRPLLVSRKLSQRLQEVRAAWCSKQTFPPSVDAADVFLTWRGRRIFDVTSCKSLGIAVDGMGTVFIPGQKIGFNSEEVEGLTEEGDADGSVKVHLEAVTEEILETLKLEKAGRKAEQGQAASSGLQHDGDAHSDSAAEMGQPLEKEVQVRIILKAKGMKDYKIIVKPTTKISQMVQVARKAFKTVEGQAVFIEFDGERLEESDMIRDTEISDLDGLDVHIK
ncbi:MAG: hypothetical protein M1822_003263 [Bathelium mastoideum]|nr:MAG: hypothetical protein M1822_003263 [Bathelium mastoideum]